MSDAVPLIIAMLVVGFGIVIGTLTNRRFGHPTFFRAQAQCLASVLPYQQANMMGFRQGHQLVTIRTATTCSSQLLNFFSGFPVGVMNHVVSFISPADLTGVASVSTELRRISESAPVWKEHCSRTFGAEALENTWLQQQLGKKRKNAQHGALTGRYGKEGDGQGQTTRAGAEHTHKQVGIVDFAIHDSPSRDHTDTPGSLSTSTWRDAFFLAHASRPDELLESCIPPSCLIMVGGRVHDLTDFLDTHPGGAMILRENSSMDATDAFERFFHSREARRIARSYVVWDGIQVMGREGTLWRYAHHGRRRRSRRSLQGSAGHGASSTPRASNVWLDALSRWTTED